MHKTKMPLIMFPTMTVT